MKDLIGAYYRLGWFYRLYLKSAFPIRHESLAKAVDSILGKPGVLQGNLVIEPLPEYPSSGKNVEAAAMDLPEEYRDLSHFARSLIPEGQTLYDHQYRSLKSVICDRKDIVVTTGTGSGKTECFLLPLLAYLAMESRDWKPADSPDPGRFWWWNGGEWKPQWGHIRRQQAMRAMVLYPLNALVEDQLKRLRSAIDCDVFHRWMDEHRGGNRITFGRYTGLTPVPGPRTQGGEWNKTKVTQLRQELASINKAYQGVLAHVNEKKAPEELLYHFQNPEGGEMWSRWDMQVSPPDILITNYSMLNIMLMRRIEEPIFDKAREWLAADQSKHRFHLIVDELHAYRGTPGSEVAYLLRQVIDRLGLTPDSDQLVVMTTTASMDEGEQGEKYLEQFFARGKSFVHIAGKLKSVDEASIGKTRTHAEAFSSFARKVHPDLEAYPSFTEKDRQEADRLLKECPSAKDAVLAACLANGVLRPTTAETIDSNLFPDGEKVKPNYPVSDALRGLLLALALASDPKKSRRLRGHFFFRVPSGAYAPT